MNTFRPSILLALAAVAPAARAGQIFSFENPIASGSYANSMFETTGLLPGNPLPFAGIRNLYTGLVRLDVTDFDASAVQVGPTQSYSARYALSNLGNPSSNDPFLGNQTTGVYATGPGTLTFFDAANPANVLLRIDFSVSALSYGNFAGAGTMLFSGSVVLPGETGNENLSFGFPDRYTQGNPLVGHHTASYTSSIGVVGVPNAPAPPALLAFGLGALMRRRKGKR